MKSYDVTIQMKPLRQFFNMVLFIYYVVLSFESVDEILRCLYFHILLLIQYASLTFRPADEMLTIQMKSL